MSGFDGIVIGGGPAGMFAAITAAGRGQKVLLLERNDRLGRKLLITGKGRCNVTNDCSAQEVLRNVPRNGRFLYSAMTAFPPEKTKAFFEARGCPLKTERGNRVFPVSDQSKSILECLQRELRRLGVTVTTDRAAHILVKEGQVAAVRTQRGEVAARWVILATGGLSYPVTGSTGDGYRMASELGHSIVPAEGSLLPLETAGSDCQEMQGLSLRNVGVKLVSANGKVLYKDFGELLFTHFGVSGPTVLSASCHLKGEDCRLVIDLKPALEEGKLDDRILRDLDKYRNRTMENALTDLLPRSLIPIVLRRLSIDPNLQANSLTKQKRLELARLLKAFSLAITGKRPVSEAIITSGGVKTGEVDPKTMGSKIVSGLFFAGEILDCDAYTGGFNLQIAWATAWAAGNAVSDTFCGGGKRKKQPLTNPCLCTRIGEQMALYRQCKEDLSMYEKLVNYAAKQLELDAADIRPDSTFDSLGIDSLDVVEMIMDLETELGVELDMEDQKITTFQELADFIDSKLA